MKSNAVFNSKNQALKNIALEKCNENHCAFQQHKLSNENQYFEFQSCPVLSSFCPPVHLSTYPPACLPACTPALMHAADTTFPFFLDKCCAWKSPTTRTTTTYLFSELRAKLAAKNLLTNFQKKCNSMDYKELYRELQAVKYSFVNAHQIR